ncbi:MAG TPA: DUF202 domain-containing protein [Thermoleophilaceae bacterium]
MTQEPPGDATRRTMLAAERTWLAWWRTGIASAAAAVAVGGVVAHLAGGSKTPYVVLGAGYAVLAAAVFIGAALRQREVERALERGGYVGVRGFWVIALTAAGLLLALGTLVVVIVRS